MLDGADYSWREMGRRRGPSVGTSLRGISIASGISEHAGPLKCITPAASDSDTCLAFIKIVIAVIWTLVLLG